MRALSPIDEQKGAKERIPRVAASPSPAMSTNSRMRPVGASGRQNPPAVDQRTSDVSHALREFHLLLRSQRLYDRDHPQVMTSLDQAYDSLRQISSTMNGLELRIERGGIVVPKLNDAPLPDTRGEFAALASDLQRAGIQTLVLAPKFHVGELDTLAQLVKTTLLRLEEPQQRTGTAWWAAQLRQNRVEGILVNTQTDRKV